MTRLPHGSGFVIASIGSALFWLSVFMGLRAVGVV